MDHFEMINNAKANSSKVFNFKETDIGFYVPPMSESIDPLFSTAFCEKSFHAMISA